MTDERFEFVTLDDTASEHIAAPQYSYWKSVFKKFFSSKVAIVMLVIISIVMALAIIHPIISGYDNLYKPHINNKADSVGGVRK